MPSDMENERGRDAGIGRDRAGSKGAETEGNQRDRRDRENAARSSSTKSKQADLQSFGATPTSSELGKKEAADLGAAIDKLNDRQSGVGGFFGDLLDIRQEIAVNPNTQAWDVKSYKEVNPLGAVVGLAANAALGPVGGSLAKAALDMTGALDSFGFEIDLGFGGETASGVKDDNPDRHDREIIAEAGGPSAAQAIGAKTAEEGAIDKAVKQILEGQKTFKFFDMPMFSVLDKDFGKDMQDVNLADLLLQDTPLKKETA